MQMLDRTSSSFRTPEDQAVLRDIAEKVTTGRVTALMLACRLDDLGDAYACVRALLIAKADPTHATKKHHLTALHVAAESTPPEHRTADPYRAVDA